MDEQKQKLIERIHQAQNILVTVSTNPTVDQLAAAIGLTLLLNKLDKHGTAVFSGQVPSTIEFLKPEDTLEKNTDSLRDFIIALDKSKADKLRYKVEDQVVRIFITPYKTSLSEADLNFSQGDFNIDVVIALGVTEQQDLDAAIVAHGRILHDATVASVTTTGQGSLGTINWVDPAASSLSEMVVSLIAGLDKTMLDNQIATALLTGIVASTERFSNAKTTPKTMSASAELMIAGANQQLIATQLNAPAVTSDIVSPAGDTVPATDVVADQAAARGVGTLEIDHEVDRPLALVAPEPQQPQIQVDEDGELHLAGEAIPAPVISGVHGVSADAQPVAVDAPEVKRGLMVEPPRLGDNAITANSAPEEVEPSSEELTQPAASSPLLSHKESVLAPEPSMSAALPPAPTVVPDSVFAPVVSPTPLPPAPVPTPATAPMFQPAPPAWQPPGPPVPSMPAPAPVPASDPVVPAPAPPPPAPPVDTLAQIEQSVGSPHVQITEEGAFSATPDIVQTSNPNVSAAPLAATGVDVDSARSAVESAYNNSANTTSLPPITALNAQPLGPDLHSSEAPSTAAPPAAFGVGFGGAAPAGGTLDMPTPSNPFGPGQTFSQSAPAPSTFPGVPQPSNGPLPPPVPPPMLPPVQ